MARKRTTITLRGALANAFVAHELRQAGDHETAQRIDPMALPPGETCGTCAHFNRCSVLGITQHVHRTTCDFHPIRFTPARPASDGKGNDRG